MNPIERDDNNILKVTYLTATFIFQPPAPLLIRPRPLMAKKREGRGDTSRCWTRTHTYRDPPRLLAFTIMLYLWAHRYFRARTKGKEICLAWKSRIPIAIRGGHASLRRDCTEMRLFFFSLFFLFFSLHRFEFVFLEDFFFFFMINRVCGWMDHACNCSFKKWTVVVSPSNGGFVTRDLQSIGCVQLALSKGNEGE